MSTALQAWAHARATSSSRDASAAVFTSKARDIFAGARENIRGQASRFGEEVYRVVDSALPVMRNSMVFTLQGSARAG